MADDDFDFGTKRRPEVKTGRRARLQDDTPNGDITADSDDLAVSESLRTTSTNNSSGAPPRPSRKQGGWADDTPKSAKKGGKKGEQFYEDERLRPASAHSHSGSDEEIPVIPDLEEFQEEDMATQIAAPPSVQVNRVATYRELDNDLLKHSQLLTLDGEIDLKLLTRVLSAESEVIEEDKPWDWDRLFTEVASDLQTEWDKATPQETDDNAL